MEDKLASMERDIQQATANVSYRMIRIQACQSKTENEDDFSIRIMEDVTDMITTTKLFEELKQSDKVNDDEQSVMEEKWMCYAHDLAKMSQECTQGSESCSRNIINIDWAFINESAITYISRHRSVDQEIPIS